MNSYPSIYNFGHAAVRELLQTEVIVEEKIDGSQLSFGMYNGELRMRSKGSDIILSAPHKMFEKAVETARELEPLLPEGYTYRGEFLAKPKHNVLAYDRAPTRNFILFDVNTGIETYLSPEQKAAEAERLGLEVVPTLYRGVLNSADSLRGLLETISMLGGQKIEGVVVKPLQYNLWGRDKKCIMAKFVSEAFKEMHGRTWTKEHRPSKADIIEQIGSQTCTEARWAKARIHLQEAGKLENSPRDIGYLIKEIPADIRKEEEENIKQQLFDWAWPKIQRAAVRGLPEWYKKELLKLSFEGGEQE